MYNRPDVFSYFGAQSYSERFPELDLAAECSVFVPFCVYDIEIPIPEVAEETLNIFERTVLRLIKMGYHSAEEVASVICVSVEFVKFIFARLIELKLAGENGFITEQGMAYFEVVGKSSRIKRKNAKVFALKETGEFIPFLLLDEYKQTDAFFEGKNNISMIIGSAGRAKKVMGYSIRAEKSAAPRMPLQQVLRKIIRDNSNVCKNMEADGIIVAENEMIESSSAVTVYMHIRTALQRGNTEDIIASEGFLANNDIIAKYIVQKAPYVRDDLYRQAVVGGDNATGTLVFSGKYKEIEQLMPKELLNEVNADASKENLKLRRENVRNLYAAIELALQYYIKICPPSDGIYHMLSTQEAYESMVIILEFSKKMGMVANNSDILCRLDVDGLAMYRKTGIPTLEIMLPLAVVSGYENDGSSFRQLVKAMPNYPDFLAKLAHYAKKSRHADNSSAITEDEYNELERKGLQFIEILLPDLHPHKLKISETNVSRARINAVHSLRQALGSMRYDVLPSDIKEELLKTSPDKQSGQLPSPVDIVMSFSKVCESCFKEYTPSVKSSLTKNEALDIIKVRTSSPAPPGLLHVQNKFFESAMKSGLGTLGAFALKYCAAIDAIDKQAEEFYQNDLHLFISELATLRGHGNSIGLNLTYDKICRLRENLYVFIAVVSN